MDEARYKVFTRTWWEKQPIMAGWSRAVHRQAKPQGRVHSTVISNKTKEIENVSIMKLWPIISFESDEERTGFLILTVLMACVIGFAVWHAHAYPPCAGLHGNELRDCINYQIYQSESGFRYGNDYHGD